jgi:hypothetical protein
MPRPKRLYLPPPDSEQRYLNLLLDPLDACARYQPKFGTEDSTGVTLEQFKILYGEDPFYHWIGLDSDLMYAAHKAAGGMTSIYRQLGAGVDNLFRAIIKDSLLISTGVLTDDDMISTYAFFRKIVGFELDAFFQRNTDAMRQRCQKILKALLTPE